MAIISSNNQEEVTNKENYVSIKIHFLFTCISFVYLILPFQDSYKLVLWGLITFLFYLYITYKEVKVSSLWLTPISVFLLWNSINVGLSSSYIGYLITTGEKINFSRYYLESNELVQSFIILIIGSFFLHLGLETLKPILHSKIKNNAKFRTLFLLFSITIIFFFFQQNLLPLGSLISPLKYGSLAALSVYGLTKVKSLNHSYKKKFKFLLLGCLLLFAINISTMSKEIMMLSFLPLLWFSILNKRARNYLILLIFLLLPLYFFIAAPLSADLRSQYWSGQEVSTSNSLKKIIQGKELRQEPTDKNTIEAFLLRSSQIKPTAYLIGEVELRGFMYGGTLKYLLYSFIPRILWSEKPNVSQSAWFTYYLGMARTPEEATSSTGITAIGELYWNFGLIGVSVGMFMLGVGFSGLWRLAGNPLNSLISMMLYIIIISEMREIAEFGSTIVMFAILFLLFKLLYKAKDAFLKKKVTSNFNTKIEYSRNIQIENTF